MSFNQKRAVCNLLQHNCTLLVAVLTVAICTACDQAKLTGVPSQNRTLSRAQPRVGIGLIDEQFRKVGALVGGFAGFYVDTDGAPTIVLTDATSLTVAKAALVSVFGAKLETRYSGQDWRVVRARYTYITLANWRDQLLPRVMSIEGVSDMGLSHRDNRVTIGVLNADAMTQVQTLLRGQGVPSDAVALRVVGVTVSTTTLLDRIRPLPAGVYVETLKNGATERCSIGPNAYSPPSSSTTAFFLIASHCTSVRAVYDGAYTYQQYRSVPGDAIGVEVIDAPYYTSANDPNCGSGRKCQYADVALIQSLSFTTPDLGDIARTFGPPAAPDEGSGSTTLNMGFLGGRMAIDNVEGYVGTPSAMTGDRIEKMGHATGWTMGTVEDPCKTYNDAAEPPFTVICQVQVIGTADFGDSGGPAFNSQYSVNLYGVQVAKGIDDLGRAVFYYSPMSSIYFELQINVPPSGDYMFCYC